MFFHGKYLHWDTNEVFLGGVSVRDVSLSYFIFTILATSMLDLFRRSLEECFIIGKLCLFFTLLLKQLNCSFSDFLNVSDCNHNEADAKPGTIQLQMRINWKVVSGSKHGVRIETLYDLNCGCHDCSCYNIFIYQSYRNFFSVQI